LSEQDHRETHGYVEGEVVRAFVEVAFGDRKLFAQLPDAMPPAR
jgi:hypothetical protein